MAGVLALNYGAERGVIDVDAARQLTISAVAVSLGAYAIFRAGWNKSFSDPAMIEPQMMAIIAFLGWGYLIGGPGRVIALMLLFIALMFGMFTIRSRQLLRSCVLAAVVFGAAFLTVASREQLVPFSAELQSVVFAVLLVILVSVSLLGHQLSMMRDASARHKQELTEALAKLQGQAIRDELTGLFNRRHMNVLLNTERSRADRSGRAWCVCMIDLDLFKHVNDDYGHNVGDEVLRSTAQVIFDGLRDADQVARWGGEEFLVMFPDTDCQAARLVLERIRQSLARTVVSHTVPDLRVTFSAGVTCYITGEALTDTVDRADHALYQAKAGGRNRTERLDKPFDPKLQESIVR
jgi:diguanylate cyclase (GGDEF)-like protein